MANENQSAGNRDRGRELAIEGLLHSRFGERPCGAAERALQEIRSSSAAADGSGARPAARARKAGGPRRKTNGKRRFAPPAGRTWPVWAKVGLAAVAALVLLVTARFVLENRKPGTGGSGSTDPKLVAHQPEIKEQVRQDTVAVGNPPGEDDPSMTLARELAWTEGFKGDGSTWRGKGGTDTGPFIGAPGSPPPGGRDGALPGSEDGIPGAPPIIGSPKPGDPGSANLRAAINACLRKLSFQLRIPEQLPSGYRLTGLTPSEAGDGVMLRYIREAAITNVFVRPAEGPDTPFRKVKVGQRVLQTARRNGLLIAVEGGPADPTECEAWANVFTSP